jgi:DNA polymerase elongation subunit (family B)
MIIDIEQTEANLKVSVVGEDGNVKFLNLPVPPEEQYVWSYCNPAQKPHPNVVSWDDKPVRKSKNRFLTKWRIEEFLSSQPEHIKKQLYTLHKPRIFFCDIETEVTDDGFPKPEIAKNAITAIAFSVDSKVIGLGTRPLTGEQIKRIENKINDHFKDYYPIEFNYIYYKSEYDMLFSFFSKALHKMPMITGWNWDGFDWPYLYNRATRLNIDPAISSPARKLVGKKNIPMHKLMVDYLDVYKKWDKTVSVKENNSLDFVSKAVLGLNKIKYSGTLQDLYEQDFEEYIFYNAVDTRLVQLIHEKIQTMQTFMTLANITGVEAHKAFSPIWMAESVMAREFYLRGKVFPKVDGDRKSREAYEGAFVFKPIPGMYEYVGAFDFASLYPSIMRQWNISPESYIHNTTEDVDPKKFIKTSSGAVFKNDEDSVFRTILANYYGKRKEAKNEMQQLEKEIAALKEYIK